MVHFLDVPGNLFVPMRLLSADSARAERSRKDWESNVNSIGVCIRHFSRYVNSQLRKGAQDQSRLPSQSIINVQSLKGKH
jgi:hypothetical protein